MKSAGVFKNLITSKPMIYMSFELRTQIMALVNGTNANECQWFHTIDRTVFSSGSRVVYTLDNMLIPEQEVSGASVESPDKGMLGIFNELRAKYATEDGKYNKDAVNAILGKMHAWCHSHVNMTASPSGTDEKTFADWIKQNESQGLTVPVIMMIVNKREEVYIRLYDPELGIYCENPEIVLTGGNVDLSYVNDAIANKIKERKLNYVGHGSDVWSARFNRPVVHSGGGSDNFPKATASQTTGTSKSGDAGSLPKGAKNLIAVGQYTFQGYPSDAAADIAKMAASTVSDSQQEAEKLMKYLATKMNREALWYLCCLLTEDETLILEAIDKKQIPKDLDMKTVVADVAEYLATHWFLDPKIFFMTIGTAYKLCDLSKNSSKSKREADAKDILLDLDIYSTKMDKTSFYDYDETNDFEFHRL